MPASPARFSFYWEHLIGPPVFMSSWQNRNTVAASRPRWTRGASRFESGSAVVAFLAPARLEPSQDMSAHVVIQVGLELPAEALVRGSKRLEVARIEGAMTNVDRMFAPNQTTVLTVELKRRLNKSVFQLTDRLRYQKIDGKPWPDAWIED